MALTSFSALTGDSLTKRNHSMVYHNGKIYVFGGFGSRSGAPVENFVDVRIYTITTDSWSAGADYSQARFEHSAVIYNGNMYAHGGSNGSSITNLLLKYNISGNSWSTLNSTGPTLHLHDSVIFGNKMYVIGGTSGAGTTYSNVAVNIYDFDTDSWTTGTTYTTSNAQFGQKIAIYQGKIYYTETVNVAGSDNDYSRMIVYDIATDSWTQKATFNDSGNGLNDYAIASDDNGNIYLFAGGASDTAQGSSMKTIFIYNITNNTWSTSISETTLETRYHRMVFNDGIFYWHGGLDVPDNVYHAVMRRTNPLVNANGAWQTLPSSGKEYIYDFKLTLNERIEMPLSDEDLFTQVIARGKDADPANYALDATVALGDPNTGGVIGDIIDYKLDTEVGWEVHDTMPAEGTVMATITLNQVARLARIDVLAGSLEGNMITEGIEVEVAGTDGIWVKPSKSSGIQVVSSGSWAQFPNDDFKDMEIQKIRILGQQWYNEFDVTTDRDLFGTDVDTQSNWQFSIAEVQIWGEEELYGYANLDNCVFVGDGSSTVAYIPNVPYRVKDTATGGDFGWDRKAVSNVTLYKNSLSTIMVLNTDYTIDLTTGKITFTPAPAKGDVICATYTLDGNDSTMVYTASFTHKTLLQRIGLRAFKDELDEGLDTHKKVIQRADDILPEVARLNLPLNAKVVYRPDIKIGDTVLVESIVSGVTRKYFVEDLTENKDGISPSLDLSMVNYE